MRPNRILTRAAALSGAAALAIAVMAASQTAASASVSTAATFPTHGGILFGGTDAMAKVAPADFGRNLKIVRTYYHIGDTFPDSVDAGYMSQGTTMLVSLDSTGQSYASIAAGTYDTQISAFLAQVNQAALTNNLSSIVISFQHEPENPKHTGYGTPAQFVAAWDHVHALAVSANLDWNQGAGGRLLWAVILTNHTWAVGTNAGGYWPGPGEADIVAADGYNSFGCGTNPAQTPSSLFSPMLSFAAANGGLPSMIAEWGSNAGQPTAQAAFITAMRAFLASHSKKIKAASYWDETTPNCNFQIDGNPASVAAMKALGASSVMQGSAHI